MVISKRVYRAKKEYICDSCEERIKKGEKYTRFFGAAYEGDPKYELMMCCSCEPIKILNKKEIIKQKIEELKKKLERIEWMETKGMEGK
jgi:hypothetical protein